MTENFKSLASLAADTTAAGRAVRDRREWGRWRLSTAGLELIYRGTDGRDRYAIDLELCGTSAAVLDWIMQIHRKRWSKVRDVGELVAALDDILDPQSTVCGFGATGHPGKMLDVTAFLKSRYGVQSGGAV